jgi:hypothetical protein
MDQHLHATLTKFRIIASIDVGQKLDTKSNELTIQHIDFWSSFYRRISSDSRECTISYLEDLILKFDKPADNLVKQNVYPQIIDSIEAIQGLINGIGNLTKTYKNDKTTGKRLGSIVKDYVLPIYKKLIYHIPLEFITDKLATKLMFMGDVIFEYNKKTPENSTTSSPIDTPQRSDGDSIVPISLSMPQ